MRQRTGLHPGWEEKSREMRQRTGTCLTVSVSDTCLNWSLQKSGKKPVKPIVTKNRNKYYWNNKVLPYAQCREIALAQMIDDKAQEVYGKGAAAVSGAEQYGKHINGQADQAAPVSQVTSEAFIGGSARRRL